MSLLHHGVQAFKAIVAQGTVHGAAREIGLSQTGVTQRIRALERELGTTLFVRSRKGMFPTAEGEALVRWCQRVDDLEGELLTFVRRGQEAQAVRVTVTGPSSLMRGRVIPQTTAELTEFPTVTLYFDLDDEGNGLNRLKTGAAQLAVIPRGDVVNELDAKPLAPARHVLVGPAAWASRDLHEVIATERIIDFNDKDDATLSFLRHHHLLTGARIRRHLVNNPDALADLVAAGLGYSVLPEDFAEARLVEQSLVNLCPGRWLDQEMALAWYPRHEMPTYFRKLIDSIQ
ncbi:MAG: LysR family transcriptional regulator [Candidatus Eisenbacteria bacterium]|uniref:LysR family transcriptional regulator n=1 Tax=Eiseniibacteriota bacterium TaxID=2212470 RepID=A0A7Y2ECB1_UNCEI|nr:LysR family transcriptional regulator [Candidatus Eisenbacteria bacterium]